MSFISYEPLFLKYRPQKLDDVLGQNSVKETLINAINNSKIVHAYLLTGPRGSGKTSTARILAKSLNCPNALDGKYPSTQPCGICPSCVSIANSSSIDVVEIDAASHGGVDDARQIVEKVNLASVTGKYRIYIIDEVHMLSNPAFNALLKVIEEPPANVVFILATTEVDKVPKTIASRCQQLRFKPITIKDCFDRLEYVAKQENINISKPALELIAERSDGAMRDALSLLDQIGVFSSSRLEISEEKIYEILGGVPTAELSWLAKAILVRSNSGCIECTNKLIVQGKDPVHIVSELADFLLRVLEAQNGLGDSNQYVSEIQSLCQIQEIENYELVQILDSLTDLEIRLKQNSKNKNLLRAWLLKICSRADILVAKEILQRIEALEQGLNNSRSAPTSPKPISIPQKTFKAPIPPSEPNITKAPAQPYSGTIRLENGVNPSNLNSYFEFLSPNLKGFLTSIKANLISLDNGVANFHLDLKPEAFKLWKARLETRQSELIDALSKASNLPIHSLNIELVKSSDNVTPSLTETVIESKTAEIVSGLDVVSTPCNTRSEDKLSEVVSAGINIFGGKEL